MKNKIKTKIIPVSNLKRYLTIFHERKYYYENCKKYLITEIHLIGNNRVKVVIVEVTGEMKVFK